MLVKTIRIRAVAITVGLITVAAPFAGAQAVTDVPVVSPTTTSPPEPSDECITQIPGVGPTTWAQVPSYSSQLVVSVATRRKSDENTFQRWEKTDGCWVLVSSWWSLNGFKGWHERPWTGSLRSPIGVFSMTDAGGRLRNPGTTMRYHYGPKKYERGGYKIKYPVQLYNYVIAINYNRKIGKPPRKNIQLTSGTGSGYWIHQRGLGSTRGCISLTKKQLVTTLQWLNPTAAPHIIMGPTQSISL